MRIRNVLTLMVPIMWGKAIRCIHLVIERGTPLPFRCFIDDTIAHLYEGRNTDRKNKLALGLSVALTLLLSNPVCVYSTKTRRGMTNPVSLLLFY